MYLLFDKGVPYGIRFPPYHCASVDMFSQLRSYYRLCLFHFLNPVTAAAAAVEKVKTKQHKKQNFNIIIHYYFALVDCGSLYFLIPITWSSIVMTSSCSLSLIMQWFVLLYEYSPEMTISDDSARPMDVVVPPSFK